MNYIKQLQEKNARLSKAAALTQREINGFISFLQSEKFQGFEQDGSRKDWISTADVIVRLMELRNTLLD